jgi:hypothetical protein
LVHNAEHMLVLASQHGTPEQAESIKSSLEKLRQRGEEAQGTLTQSPR